MDETLKQLASLWKQYIEDSKESRKLPDEALTEKMREEGMIYFKADFNGFMNWLADKYGGEKKDKAGGVKDGIKTALDLLKEFPTGSFDSTPYKEVLIEKLENLIK